MNSRLVWYIGIVIGAIMLVIAIVASKTGLAIAGAIVLVVCLIFLYASYKSKGVVD